MVKKYCFIENEQTKEVRLGAGVDEEYYASIGMQLRDVEQAYNGNWYLKGYAPVKPETTVQEKVQALESQTGLTRVVRELVLAQNSGASEYVKSKAREIETLAEPLRADNTEAGETVPEAQEAADDAGTV